MTGPEHYRVAERLIERLPSALDEIARTELGADAATVKFALDHTVALAQVHATLALAAATAATQATAYDGDEDGSRSRGWAGVA